ncbi:hypothetical protein BGX34_001131 [Mortierella sp. NVP85]|nr:hypothetical protein BGX34_001131 [Mortierella sp. NVP85]
MLSSKDPMVPQRPPGAASDHQSQPPQPPQLQKQHTKQSSAAAAPTPTAPTPTPTPAAAIVDSTNQHINAHPFFWSGPTFSTGYLEPLAEVDIVFTACFMQHGVYDINRWRLSMQVVKAQPKKKVAKHSRKQKLKTESDTEGNDNNNTLSSPTLEEDEEEERQAMLPPAAPQGIGKGFVQMPNLAHYIQVS